MVHDRDGGLSAESVVRAPRSAPAPAHALALPTTPLQP
jgi:hypothetical protein